MRRLLIAAFLLTFGAAHAFARAPLTLACEDGNKTITISGLSASQKVMGSFPSCTVNVYLPGTTTPATIYADNVGTPKANPFTALTTGWFTFYADDGCYDVRRSGGGISAPFTQPFCIFDSSGGGGGGGGYATIQDEGIALPQETILNFIGIPITCADDPGGTRTNCTLTAYSTIQDEGVSLTQRPTVNFIGSGVSCVDNAGSTRTDCTVSGGGSSDAWIDGGNSFSSTTPTIGNLNNKDMKYVTNNLERFRITSGGLLSFGANSTGVGFTNTGTNGTIAWPHAYAQENTNSHAQTIGIGDGTTTNFVFTLRQVPIAPSSVTVFVNHVSEGTDNGAGVITGGGIAAGTIDYATGDIDVTFTAAPGDGEYVEITDTITGNAVFATTNSRAFLYTPNDIKTDRGLGAVFTVTDYNELTTEGSGSSASADLGTVKTYFKSDSVDPLTTKKNMFQKDSTGDEREFCYHDSPCPNGWWPDINLRGGIFGAFTNANSTGQSIPFGDNDTVARATEIPFDAWVYSLGFCINAVGSNAGYMANAAWYVDSYQGTTSAAVYQINNMSYGPTPATNTCSVSTFQPQHVAPFTGLGLETGFRPSGAGPAMTAWSAEIINSTSQWLGTNMRDQNIGIGATGYYGFGLGGSGIGWQTTPTQVTVPVPYTSTARNLCVRTTTAVTSGGFTVTLMKNGSDSALTIPLGATASASLYCDRTHTVSLVKGDYLAIKGDNTANTGAIQTRSVTMELVPSGSETAMIIFPGNPNAGFTGASVSNYTAPFSYNAPTTTEANRRAPMPRDGTIGNLQCYVKTAPASAATVVTLMKNGSTTGVTATLPLATTGVVAGTGTVSISQGDSFDLQYALGAGSNPTVPSCSISVI